MTAGSVSKSSITMVLCAMIVRTSLVLCRFDDETVGVVRLFAGVAGNTVSDIVC